MLIVYLDETGDHSMEKIDRDFPIFCLVMFICDEKIYTGTIVPEVYDLKIDTWGHENVVLHSRDIRKAQGDFGFLTNEPKRQQFYRKINKLMGEPEYTLIASVIKKTVHRERYGITAGNPYELALTFSLERLLPMLEQEGQSRVILVAESRGKREDDELRLAFLSVVHKGDVLCTGGSFSKNRFSA